MISLIVAAADNNVIGKDNKMPWHISEDFRRFKSLTMGKPCIMGRKTFESILAQLGRPLPGRANIVVSRKMHIYEDALSAASLDLAIAAAKETSPPEIFIIGGAQIYKESLERNLVDKIYLTRVHQSPDGDAFFPALGSDWEEQAREDHPGFSFIDLLKKHTPPPPA